MRPVLRHVLRPVLRPVLRLRQSMPQAATRKLQRAGRIVFHVCVRAIAGRMNRPLVLTNVWQALPRTYK